MSHGHVSMAIEPSLMRSPQDVMGACTPRPKKLMNDSSSMTLGIVSVMQIIIVPIMLGIMCLRIIFIVDCPRI